MFLPLLLTGAFLVEPGLCLEPPGKDTENGVWSGVWWNKLPVLWSVQEERLQKPPSLLTNSALETGMGGWGVGGHIFLYLQDSSIWSNLN